MQAPVPSTDISSFFSYIFLLRINVIKKILGITYHSRKLEVFEVTISLRVFHRDPDEKFIKIMRLAAHYPSQASC